MSKYKFSVQRDTENDWLIALNLYMCECVNQEMNINPKKSCLFCRTASPNH